MHADGIGYGSYFKYAMCLQYDNTFGAVQCEQKTVRKLLSCSNCRSKHVSLFRGGVTISSQCLRHTVIWYSEWISTTDCYCHCRRLNIQFTSLLPRSKTSELRHPSTAPICWILAGDSNGCQWICFLVLLTSKSQRVVSPTTSALGLFFFCKMEKMEILRITNIVSVWE